MTLNREDVKRVTRELIEEVGEDYVYPGADTGYCSYSGAPEDKIPACLVGQIVQRLDPEAYEKLIVVETEGLAGHTDFNYRQALAPSIQERTPVIDTGDDAPLTQALIRAQRAQDDGVTWSLAAEEILNLE